MISHRSIAGAALAGLVTLLGAALATSHFAGATPRPANDRARPEGPRYTILPGKGLKECSLGMPERTAIDLFGRPHWTEQGVEVEAEAGKIAAMFFHYRSRKVVTFDGTTDRGLGMWSTIPEVRRLYGKPSRVGDSIVSEFGPMPGARDYTMEYARLGISFTFYNNELGHIAVYAPRK
jgi:hypothetical protein